MPTYPKALNASNEIVSIDQIGSENSKELYYCLGCNEQLIPKRGKINAHHFAHKKDGQCSGETYLHKLAKLTFLNIYKDCLENEKAFFLEYKQKYFCEHHFQHTGVKCHSTPKTNKLNLIDHFKEIYLEKKDGQFIPDILLKNNRGKKLYVEFAVTHHVETGKINSQVPIIEFTIRTEEDFNLFLGCTIRLHDYPNSISKYNFKEVRLNDCKGQCRESYHSFHLFKSNKYILMHQSLNDFLNTKRKSVYSNIIDENPDFDRKEADIISDQINKAHSSGLSVKNCNLCSFSKVNSYKGYYDRGMQMWNYDPDKSGPLFCKKKWIAIEDKEAIKCQDFQVFQ